MKRVVIAGDTRIEYTLIQSVRASVLFRVEPGGVRVYAPKAMRLRDVDALVRERSGQIEDMLREVDRRLTEDRRNHPVTRGSTLLIEGRPHTLQLARAPKVSSHIADGVLHLSLPDPESDPAVRGAIRSALSARALVRIRERIEHFAPMLGVTPGRITIRDQKTRWGSCSDRGNLNFNWKLIMAPPKSLDYVVVHELCHLRIFNHSARFWALVESVMPDYKPWMQWLKDHKEDLYL